MILRLCLALLFLTWSNGEFRGDSHVLPSCRLQTTGDWRPCSYGAVKPSDYCCSGGYAFRRLDNVTTVLDSDGTANVTFNFTATGSDMFVIDNVDGCSSPSDCFLLEPMEAKGRSVGIELSFLPGNAAYEALHADQNDYFEWASDRNSSQCQYLNASEIKIDLIGSDAELSLQPPKTFLSQPATISGACVMIYSSKNKMKCDYDGMVYEGNKQSLCFPDPYNNTLLIRNVTGFHNGVPGLMYSCVVVNMGRFCSLHSSLTAVTPLQRDRPILLIPRRDLTLAIACLVVVSTAAFGLMFCFKRLLRFSTETSHHEQQTLCMKVVMLYCKENSEHFESMVEALMRAVKTEYVEIIDPYEDEAFLPTNAVFFAISILRQPGIRVLFLATERALLLAGQNSPPASTFDAFFTAAFRMIQEQPALLEGNRFMTLLTKSELELPPIMGGVYRCPDMIDVLIQDIQGACVEDTDRLTDLTRCINRYNMERKFHKNRAAHTDSVQGMYW